MMLEPIIYFLGSVLLVLLIIVGILILFFGIGYLLFLVHDEIKEYRKNR